MDQEDKMGEADLPVAFMPNLDVITTIQMDGMLTMEEFEQAVNIALDGCEQIYKLQKDALKKKFVRVTEEAGE